MRWGRLGAEVAVEREGDADVAGAVDVVHGRADVGTDVGLVTRALLETDAPRIPRRRRPLRVVEGPYLRDVLAQPVALEEVESVLVRRFGEVFERDPVEPVARGRY